MNTNLFKPFVRLFLQRALAFSAITLAAVFVLTGCATSNQETSGGKTLATAVEPAHSEIIILREGDIVKISFPGSPNLNNTQQIRRDGKISLQLVGEVQASGLTPEDLQDSLIKLYSSQIASKEITVSLESSSFPIFVTGAVVHPGKILSDHPITALEAVMEAGGFDYTVANLKTVKIIRNEDGVMKHYTVNLKKVLAGDKDAQPFYLKPSDIIYVSDRFELF
jgi:polysaccharide biosynthesis/export protein